MTRVIRFVAAVSTVLAVVVPAQAASAHGTTCTVTAANAAIDAEEQQFLTLINQYRVANGRSALTISSAATRAASWFSWDMATDNYLPPNHVDTNGRDIPTRVTWCGVNWSAVAENIYAGNGTAQAAFDWWRNSAVHNTNMLSTAVTRIGIARHFNAASTYGWYWTTDFVTETAAAPSVAGSAWYTDGTNTQSGPAGTTVRAYAVGAFTGVAYQMVLATTGCGSVAAVLNVNTRFANSSGFISQTVGVTPPGVPPGSYVVCFKSTADITTPTATGSVAFTAT